MAKDGWQVRLTEVVATQIRRYRKLRGLSTRALADRCAELGLAVPQPVLSNLELGRRESVSLAELLVLAAALEVPPVELAIPLARQETIEILPGLELPTWHAARWFRGDAALTGVPLRYDDGQSKEPDLPIELLVAHEDLMVQSFALDSLVEGSARMMGLPELSEQNRNQLIEQLQKFQSNRDNTRAELARHRAIMRRRGLMLPPLPPELAGLDDQYPDPLGEEDVSAAGNAG